MKLQLCSFELSKTLKKIGFNENVFLCYWRNYNNEYILTNIALPNDYHAKHNYSAPTLELAKMWFRKKHKINIVSEMNYEDLKWYPNLCYINKEPEWLLPGLTPKTCSTYEIALEKGLKQACLLIKNKQL